MTLKNDGLLYSVVGFTILAVMILVLVFGPKPYNVIDNLTPAEKEANVALGGLVAEGVKWSVLVISGIAGLVVILRERKSKRKS